MDIEKIVTRIKLTGSCGYEVERYSANGCAHEHRSMASASKCLAKWSTPATKRRKAADLKREMYAKFKAAGLCARCGLVPPVKERTRCRCCLDDCAAANQRYAAKRNQS